jgi:hypothetical protein
MDELPYELREEISMYIPVQKQHLLLLSKKEFFLPTKNFQIKHNLYKNASRIALFIRLNQKILRFFKILTKCINSYYRFMHCGEFICAFNQNCMMYAPVSPHGICRFCGKPMHTHKYRKMVDIFMTLINQKN